MLLPLQMNLEMFTPAPFPVGVRVGGLSRVAQPAKAAGETSRIVFDFISRLFDGEFFVSAVFNISIYSGVGSATPLVAVGTPALAGTKISQLFSGGSPGNIYLVECIGTTNLGSVPYLTSYLTVR